MDNDNKNTSNTQGDKDLQSLISNAIENRKILDASYLSPQRNSRKLIRYMSLIQSRIRRQIRKKAGARRKRRALLLE